MNFYKQIAQHSFGNMMRFLLIFSIGTQLSIAQKQLSQEEKIADFNYLHQELKESYPYFGINKRAFKTDWLSNKQIYLEAIQKTKNDEDFFDTINSILHDLNNGHTDMYPTIIYDYFYKAYQQGASQDTIHTVYVKELQKTDSIRTNYWKKINHKLYFPGKKEDSQEEHITTTVTPQNIHINFIDSIATAMIHIKSFSHDLVENDIDTLARFFEKAHQFKNLIIDIQGNDGGSTNYWLDHIVPHLIDKELSTSVVYAFKDSERLQKFKPNYFENTINYSDIKLPNLPQELTDGSYLFRREDMTVSPTEGSKKYAGTIYLLVDNIVYSSSETLAVFCKATGFATVVGEKTNGDGVGTDPLLLTLPNSGIVIRFTGEMGLNPDGSANDETKTVPDMIIEASNRTERTFKFLKFLQQKK